MPKNLGDTPVKSKHVDTDNGGLDEDKLKQLAGEDDEDEEDQVDEDTGDDAVDPPEPGADDAPADQEDEEPPPEDAKPAGDTDEEDHDDERSRRRLSKKERRERARAARDADKQLIKALTDQLKEVKGQVSKLDIRSNQLDMARLDEAISAQAMAYRRAEAAMQSAMTKQDPKAFTAALEARDQARDRHSALVSAKQGAQSAQTTRQKPSFDPVVVNLAKKFADDHKWYDIQGKDQDSKIVMSLDQQLIDEGFVPATPQYWQELRARTKRFLPHRFEGQDRQKQNGQQRGKRPAGKPNMGQGGFSSGGGVQKGSGPVLSKARREALLTMGLEPGSKEWNDYVKSYQQYDKANPRRQ